MRDTLLIPSLIESTDRVRPEEAFAFWRGTALQNVGTVHHLDAAGSFSAKRLAAVSTHGTLLFTESSPVGFEGDHRYVRQIDRDDVFISLGLAGQGYVDQNGCGALVERSDLSFVDLKRPFAIGGHTPYREIRFSVPRHVFEAQVGGADAVGGRHIRASPLCALFQTYLLAVAQSITGMTDAEAGLAIEGALHLLRPLVHGADGGPDRGGISPGTLRSLAQVQIQRRLHDPAFDPMEICAALNVSRTKLYGAFGGGEGVAAAIRDARLDRVHRQLSFRIDDRRTIAVIAYACGFTDMPTFNRAFKRRFGMTPRDVRGLRDA